MVTESRSRCQWAWEMERKLMGSLLECGICCISLLRWRWALVGDFHIKVIWEQVKSAASPKVKGTSCFMMALFPLLILAARLWNRDCAEMQIFNKWMSVCLCVWVSGCGCGWERPSVAFYHIPTLLRDSPNKATAEVPCVWSTLTRETSAPVQAL